MWLFVWDSEPSKIFVGDTQISKVFLWDTQVRPSGWQPWANTILYMPFKSDLLDHSSNNISFTNTNVTLVDGTAYFNGSASLINSSFTTYLSSMPFTCSIWVKVSSNTKDAGIIGAHKKVSWTWGWWDIQTINSSWYKYRLEVISWWAVLQTSAYSTWTRYLLTWVVASSKTERYINWVSQWTVSWWVARFRSEFAIWQQRWDSSTSNWRCFTWYMSDLILENKARTAQEIADYYNLTKWNYWF